MAQLKIVNLVVQSKLASANARDDVSSVISDMLIADMSLARACELSHVGSVSLLDLMWMRSLRDAKSNRWTIAKLLQSDRHYYRWEFCQALQQAVRLGDFIMVQWILQHFSGCVVTRDVVEEAARCGQLGMLQLLERDKAVEGVQWSMSSLNEAAKHGHWNIVRWLFGRLNSTLTDKLSNKAVVKSAIKQNKLEQVKWAVSAGYGITIQSFPSCPEAEWPTRTEIISFLVKARDFCDLVSSAALDQAAAVGDLAFVKWLANRHIKRSDGPLLAFIIAAGDAASGGHVAILQWLLGYMEGNYDGEYEMAGIMFAAASNGKVDVVRWLYERLASAMGGSLFDDEETESHSAMDAAACNGHLDALKYLHNADSEAYKRRKNDGDTKLVGFCYANCSKDAMDDAAKNGHLDVVKWLQ